MSELVNDVDHYHEFLPWCGGSRVLSRDEAGYTASVDIAFKGLKKTFTTRNTRQVEGEIERTDITLVDGPFSELTGNWLFEPISEGASRISLRLEFGFSNKLVEKVVGPVFKAIADSMVDSFCRRADHLAAESAQ